MIYSVLSSPGRDDWRVLATTIDHAKACRFCEAQTDFAVVMETNLLVKTMAERQEVSPVNLDLMPLTLDVVGHLADSRDMSLDMNKDGGEHDFEFRYLRATDSYLVRCRITGRVFHIGPYPVRVAAAEEWSAS